MYHKVWYFCRFVLRCNLFHPLRSKFMLMILSCGCWRTRMNGPCTVLDHITADINWFLKSISHLSLQWSVMYRRCSLRYISDRGVPSVKCTHISRWRYFSTWRRRHLSMAYNRLVNSDWPISSIVRRRGKQIARPISETRRPQLGKRPWRCVMPRHRGCLRISFISGACKARLDVRREISRLIARARCARATTVIY